MANELLPTIILPSPEQKRPSELTGYDIVQEYRRAYEEEHKGEPWIENTKGWYHDPEWRTRTMSVQHARDASELKVFSPVWTTVGVLWCIAQVWIQVWPMFHRFH